MDTVEIIVDRYKITFWKDGRWAVYDFIEKKDVVVCEKFHDSMEAYK